MTYKTILLHVDGEPASESLVRAAASTARIFDATLAGVGAVAWELHLERVVSARRTAEREAVHTDILEQLARAETLFRRAAGSVPILWRAETDYPDRVMAAHACGADLLVAARPDGWCDIRVSAKPGDLLMFAGLPVLVAPPSPGELSGDVVVVAWKNTLQARRAVSASLPFLKRARAVLVAAACDGETAPVDELDDVLGRLQRHGVAARAVALTAPEEPGPALMNFARREGADLIVAGAYGSSRAQEWAFGGVTQALLERATQFVLFSH